MNPPVDSVQIEIARTHNGVPFSEVPTAWSSIGELLRMRAMAEPDRTWMVYLDEDGSRVELTRRTFYYRVLGVARHLRREGVTAGSRVATLAHNHPDTVVTYYALWTLGATAVPLNPGEDDERLLFILRNSAAVAVVTRSGYAERLTRLLSRLESPVRVLCANDSRESPCIGVDFASVASDGAPPLLPRLHQENAPCLIVYTSGTTGVPKGVVLTQGNLLVDATAIADWHRIDASAPMMCVLPIHHVNGTVVTLVTPMVADSSVVLNRRFRTGTFFETIASEGVGVVSVVPTLLAFLSGKEIDRSNLDLSRFRHIICGAGPLTCELAERFESMYNVPIIHGYGLSETTCYSCFLPIDLSDEERRSWLTDHGFPSIGVPIDVNDMAILDGKAGELDENVRGEIAIRGHTVAAGYFENPEANRSAFTDGWFRSGDEGFWQRGPDGRSYFFITGRLKELIIRGGVNISPLEIDEVINAHPGVDQGLAVGFANEWYGEEVGAYVRRADPEVTEEALLAALADALPFAKRPKVVVFGDDIPVTSTGKYKRNRLVELFADHRTTQFRDER